jgi:drug/metabolite transporter (DMT)-like permease
MTAALIVIMAALLAISPAAIDPRHLPAMLVSLSAPISFGFGINVLIHRLMPLKPIKRVAAFSTGASVSLIPLMMLAAPGSVTPQTAEGWWLVAGLALGTALLPQLLYVSFAPMIGAARSAMAGSVELPTMFIVSWFMLGETIGLAQWASCLLITLAILMTPASARRNMSTQMVMPSAKQKEVASKRLSDTWF